MRRTRLFRSIVVFGTSLGAGGALATTALTGCDIYLGRDQHPTGSGSWGFIDAGLPIDSHVCNTDGGACHDGSWGFIDAGMPIDSWGTIADANPDGNH